MTEPTETARALLWRHGLPEDIIDGALILHAQEMATVQRKAHDDRRPYFHMGLPCTPRFDCHVAELIDLIDPTKDAAAVSAGVAPATDQNALVEIAAQAIRDSNGTPAALEWWRTHPQLIPAHVYAAAVLAVLPATVNRADDDRLRCPQCDEDITDYSEDDHVYRTGDDRPYCSGECVVAAHRSVGQRVSPADRAAILLDAAGHLARRAESASPAVRDVILADAAELRRVAAEARTTEPELGCAQCGHAQGRHMGDEHERGCHACWDSPANGGWNHRFHERAATPPAGGAPQPKET